MIPQILLALQGFYPLILAAFASIWAKVLAQGFMERLVAFLTFQGLHILAQKSSNAIDDQLLVDAAVAYYGYNPWLEGKNAVLAKAVPSPVQAGTATGATFVLPEANTPAAGAAVKPYRRSQELDELGSLR